MRRRWFNWDNLIATLLVFALMALFPLLFSPEFLRPVRDSLADFHLTDIYFSTIRGEESVEADENIVIINSAGLSIKGLLKLIELTDDAGAAVIGVNNLNLDYFNKNDQEALVELLNNDIELIIDPGPHSSGDFAENIYFDNKDLFGSGGFGIDSEHNTLRNFFAKSVKSDEFPFAIAVVNKIDENKIETLSLRNQLQEPIYYRGNVNKFYHLEAIDILKGEQDIDFIEGKIVLIGKAGLIQENVELEDVYFTPLNKQYLGKAFPDMYGTVVHANIISMIINETYINSMPMILSLILAFIVCFFNMAIFKMLTNRLPMMYEFLSLAIFVVESIILLYLTILFMAKFNYEFKSTMAIFTAALSVIMFEMYHSSIKPLSLRALRRLRKSPKKTDISN
jgi:hypothetical protein